MAAAWSKSTWIGWSFMTLMAIGVAGYGAFAALASTTGELPSMTHHFPDRVNAAAAHFAIGGLVLLIGPFQFLPAFRSRWPKLHRWIGRLYVAGCLTSAAAALMLAPTAMTGSVARWGFSLLAVFWIVTTSVALVKARQRKFVEHRRWMIRSYALTLAAVTLRLYLPLSLAVLELPFDVAYPAIAFACWVPNAFVAEWLVRKP